MAEPHPHHSDVIEDNIDTHPVRLAIGVGIGAIALVVGIKMLAHSQIKALLGAHFNLYLLGLVLLILAAGVVASMIANRRQFASMA